MSNPTLKLLAGRGVGGGPATRERAEGRIPGILYGEGGDPVPVSVNRADLRHALANPKGQNALLDVELDGSTFPAIVKELQRHPVRRDVLHFDVQRVSPDKQLTVVVPVALVGNAREVTSNGGMIEQKLSSVKIRCRADSIPREMTAQVDELRIGRSLQVKDLDVLDGVRVMTDPLKAIASAQLTRAAVVAQRAEKQGRE
jgi:large subunit ribosomal protein L25